MMDTKIKIRENKIILMCSMGVMLLIFSIVWFVRGGGRRKK